MVTKYREYGSEVEHCSNFHVSFRFTKHSRNVYKTEAASPGAHCRFVFGHVLVRFADFLLRSATFSFVILPVGIGLNLLKRSMSHDKYMSLLTSGLL